MPFPRRAESPEVRIRYLRPPDRIEVFVQTLVHEDPGVKITVASQLARESPLEIHDRIALEDGSDALWFTFPDTWHDIGRFHRADGTLTGIYANIITPCCFLEGGIWETTDLFLDLWIPAEGGVWPAGPVDEIFLLDEEELDEAAREGWVDAATARRARWEAAKLLEAAAAGLWPPGVVREGTRERARLSIDRPD